MLDAHVSDAGNADYLALRNVDWRSATDSSYFTTEFKQASVTWDQQIGDQLKMDVLYGRSSSINDNKGMLVEFNRMDSPETFTYDERAHGSMPAINYGFDLADPNNWSLVKGFSSIRHFQRETDNEYEGGHVSSTSRSPTTWAWNLVFRSANTSSRRIRRSGSRRRLKTRRCSSSVSLPRIWVACTTSVMGSKCRQARRERSSRRTSTSSARSSASIATA